MNDPRHITAGLPIPTEGYCDQPYAVKTDDGHLLLCVTTGSGAEGASGQHVISMRTDDFGRSWKDVTDVSPASLPESSYAVLYKTDFGRIYCFYNYNADNLRQVKADDPPFTGGFCRRVDTQGHFVFRYSDDHGRSWSGRWYDIPMRAFAVDRANPYGGEIKFFWNVGKPFARAGEVFIPIYKIGAFGEGFMRYSEGALLCCSNLDTERDPGKLAWQTLPKGDAGIRAPREASIISEEHSFTVLSDGTVFCVFRTVSGHPWCACSYDGCRSFKEPQIMRFADGRPMKHPRAANFIWKDRGGDYYYWFHNHGGKSYEGRNPAWLSRAREIDTPEGRTLAFSEPIPFLYDPDPMIRISYPDFIGTESAIYITETQKTSARIHRFERSWLDAQFQGPAPEDWQVIGDRMPELPAFTVRSRDEDQHGEPSGCRFLLEFYLVLPRESAVLFSTMAGVRGLELRCLAERSRLELVMGDGERSAVFVNEDPCLFDGRAHTVRAVFDGGVHAVWFVNDGHFWDGGELRSVGWGRFDPSFTAPNGRAQAYRHKAVTDVRLAEIK